MKELLCFIRRIQRFNIGFSLFIFAFIPILIAISGCATTSDLTTYNLGGGGGGDTTAPTAVTLNDPSNATSSSLDLSWTKNDDSDFASYKLYRDTSSGVSTSSTLVTTITNALTLTYQDSGLTASTKYYYKVYVFDTAGLSTASNETNGSTSVENTGTWTTQTSGTSYSLHGLYFVDFNTGWAVGDHGTILKTTNGGTTWTTQTSGTSYSLYGVYFVDSNTGWTMGDGGIILKTTNGGTTGTAQTSGVSDSLRGLYFVNSNTGWAVGDGGKILKTTNDGTTWTAQTSGKTGLLTGIYFVDANTGWVVGASGTILKYSSE